MPFTWKKVWVWVALEATRGVKNSQIQYRFPRTDNTFSDKANIESDSGVVDTIVDSINSEVTKQRSEWTIWGQVYPNGIWFFLKALLWNVVSTWDWIYEHQFSLLESNTHPTLTVWSSTPLWSNSYPLAMIESMDFTAEVWGKFTVSINLKARKWEEEAEPFTVSYTDENWFIANMLKVFLADNLEGLDIADNICLQSITVSIKKEIKDIECLSSIDPIDYINSSFSIEGSMEMLFEDNTYKDYFLNGTPKALRLLAEDTKHPYEWVDNYPTFMLDLAKIKITDWTPAFTVDDVTKQSISFKGHYDVKSKKAIEVYLKNTQPSYDSDSTPDEDDPNATYTHEEVRNPEAQRYEFIINKTSNNRVKSMKLYMNYHPTNTELSRSITREKIANWITTAEESNTQVNTLTRNWIVNSKINDNEFWASNWNFLWDFDLDTSYIHYFIQKLNDYDYVLWQKYLEESELINPYPFTISHDDTLIKHGYQWDEIIAWGQDAEDFISYVHNHEDVLIYDNDGLEAELREMNRYSYNMNYNIRDNGWEFNIIGNYSWSQQHHCVRNADWDYTIIDQREWTETQTDQAKWESVLSMFETYRETNDYPEDATRISLDNSQYNSVMSIIWGSQITEISYEWTDEVQ